MISAEDEEFLFNVIITGKSFMNGHNLSPEVRKQFDDMFNNAIDIIRQYSVS